MNFKKIILKSFSVALLLTNGIKTMDLKKQQCQNKEIQQVALACVIGHIPKQIALNILKDNPSITGPQLAHMFRGIFSRNMIRKIHQEIWAILRPIKDIPCTAALFALAENAKCNRTSFDMTKLWFQESQDFKATLKTLRNICYIANIPLQIVTIQFKKTGGGESFAKSQQLQHCFEISEALTKSSPTLNQYSWITNWIPQTLVQLFNLQPEQQHTPQIAVLCIPGLDIILQNDFGHISELLLANLSRNIYPNTITLGIKQPQTDLGQAVLRRGQVMNSVIQLRDDRAAILKNLVPSTRFDLMPTMDELARKSRGFTCGQLLQLMDEAYLDAAFENSEIQSEHIIGAYNRARRNHLL